VRRRIGERHLKISDLLPIDFRQVRVKPRSGRRCRVELSRKRGLAPLEFIEPRLQARARRPSAIASMTPASLRATSL
jgi:hypothetical protein